MKHTAFDTYHPCVPALYLLAVLTFTMAAFHPVFVTASFAVAIAYNMFLRGWRAALHTVVWQLPLLAIIAVFNFVFSASGSTLLFTCGHQGFFLESLLYGLCMGLSLLAVMQWFSNLSHVLTSDKLMQLTGNVAPTLGLMIAMVLRLIPQFLRRNGAVSDVQKICTAAGAGASHAADAARAGQAGAARTGESVGGAGEEPGGETFVQLKLNFFERRARGIRSYLRDISVLMAWGLEDSLDAAEAMRARGWGAASKRSTYKRSSFKFRDGAMLVVLVVLIALSAACALAECSHFSFYPALSPIEPWWGYVAYFILLVVPFVLEAKERLAWGV